MEPAHANLDQIAALLAARPPRKVPPELQRAAMRRTAPILFIAIGAAELAFAMMFVIGFFPWNLTRQWRFDASETATTPGKIVAVEVTSVSIGKKAVRRFTFEYSVPSMSGLLRGTCYVTGSPWAADAKVVVHYSRGDPSLACVEGARLTKTGGMAAFVLILPAIGVTLIAVGLVIRHRTMRILVHGHSTEAHVIGLERTGTVINNNPVYQIKLKRIDRPGDPPLVMNKSDPGVVGFAQERMESKLPVFVLFDPRRPKSVLMPEVL